GADAGGGIAGAGAVTLIGRGADDGVRAYARPRLTGIALRAGVAVGSAGGLGVGRVGADAGGGVARAGAVTVIGGGADDRVGADARPRLTGIALRAGVAVAAGRAIGLGRIGADAGGDIAGAGAVTLIGGGADDGVGADARPRLTGIALRAGVAVVA